MFLMWLEIQKELEYQTVMTESLYLLARRFILLAVENKNILSVRSESEVLISVQYVFEILYLFSSFKVLNNVQFIFEILYCTF